MVFITVQYSKFSADVPTCSYLATAPCYRPTLQVSTGRRRRVLSAYEWVEPMV